MNVHMALNADGKALIKKFEGCRLTAYKCTSAERYYTIGYGHYGADVKAGMTITQAQADVMFEQDIARFVAATNATLSQYCTFMPNENQFAALVSFCYNCGAGNLRNLVRNKSAATVCANMGLYTKSGGRVLQGLVTRRKTEQELFNKAVVNSCTDASTNSIVQLKCAAAQQFTKSIHGTYETTANLNCRTKPSTQGSQIIPTLPNGSRVRNYGYHTGSWYYVAFTINNQTFTGYVSSAYLRKV